MKEVEFLGNSLDVVRSFSVDVKRAIGFQIERLQNGLEPDDWKPMKSIGQGVREIRVRQGGGAYRAIYIATIAEAVFILHAFEKKTQETAKRDLDIATSRLKALRNQSPERKK